MPVVALFFLLLPLGLESFALTLLNEGIQLLLALAHGIAALPHAQFFVPSLPLYGLACFVVGLLWVCLWHTRTRYYGAIAMVIGVMSLTIVQTPDVLLGPNLKQVAFRSGDGYVLARGRTNSMIPELWANGLGFKALEKAEPPQWRCDKFGCVAQVKGKRIAFPNDPSAVMEDCQHADMVVAALSPLACDTKARMLDARSLGTSVTALWVADGGDIRVESSADWQGDRPWSVAGADDEADAESD
jgi:competence protein ComEC